jgi:Flp pilus assembly protein TadD
MNAPTNESKPALTPPRRPASLERVIAAVKAGNVEEARRLSPAALAEGVEHPLLLNLRALDHEAAGRFEAALVDLRRAHVLAPKDFATLNACGLCLIRLERHEEALACFDQVLALNPDFADGWANRGACLERLGEKAKAASAYGKAVDLNPADARSWANMAFLATRRGDAAVVRNFADRALSLDSGNVTARLALAEAELATPALAEARLRGMLGGDLHPTERGLAFSLLGDALDALDRPADAFKAYELGNRQFRDTAHAQFEAPGQETLWTTLAVLNRWAAGPRGVWPGGAESARPGEGGERVHVFLMGFPRSGTTLMETILANHPDVVSLEERDTLQASARDFLASAEALTRLEAASDRTLRRYREDYWARVRRFGVEPWGKVFIDKNPFNTLKLPVINALFPSARVIFAIRDPRDVVLSCFRRRFNLNASTYEFLDLGRTAAYYDQSMRLAEALRTRLTFSEHALVYERLVEDLPAVAREACAFIGVSWREELADIAGRARRGDVASASSAQIARGLYSDGAGQWRRYREQMAPVLPVLAPWVERFGYPAD